MRVLTRTLVGGLAGAGLLAAIVMGPFLARVETFEAVPERGFHAPYHVYVSRAAKRAAEDGRPVVLLVQPNNSGTTSDDPRVHARDAWWTTFGRHRLAEQLGVVLLVPAFVRPATDWQVYTHALDRDVLTTDRSDLRRIDLQLIAMIDQTRAFLQGSGLAVEERILLQGYSASGMFANRFAVLHPKVVRAVAVGSPGGWPIAPVAEFEGESLPFPAGIADLESLVGADFDVESFRAIEQLVVMGSLDDNDSLDFTDGWDESTASLVKRLFGPDPLSRWRGAQSLYSVVTPNAEFLLVEGVGHDRRALQSYSTAFFERILHQNPE